MDSVFNMFPLISNNSIFPSCFVLSIIKFLRINLLYFKCKSLNGDRSRHRQTAVLRLLIIYRRNFSKLIQLSLSTMPANCASCLNFQSRSILLHPHRTTLFLHWLEVGGVVKKSKQNNPIIRGGYKV